MAKKVIIGIHGLANKPEAKILEGWWKKSLVEGLHNLGVKNPTFDFKMVYWANFLYKNHQHMEELFSFDALYSRSIV